MIGSKTPPSPTSGTVAAAGKRPKKRPQAAAVQTRARSAGARSIAQRMKCAGSPALWGGGGYRMPEARYRRRKSGAAGDSLGVVAPTS